MAKKKIDLTLLKRLVSELETLVTKAEVMSADVKSDKNEWILELSKATGVAAGVLTEAGLLMSDIQHAIAGSPADPASSKEFLNKLLGGLKGPGNTN
jgi:hypothetical protein